MRSSSVNCSDSKNGSSALNFPIFSITQPNVDFGLAKKEKARMHHNGACGLRLTKGSIF
jgi:hypothetical protein